MAVDIIQRTYNNTPFTFYKGIDTNGDYGPVNKFVHFIEEGTKYKNNLTGRFFPDYQVQQFDTGAANGNLSSIKTYYKWALFYDDGTKVKGTEVDKHPVFGRLMVWTNDADQASFEMQFATPIGSFLTNGFARGVFGQNNYPVINTDPARQDVPMWGVIPETEASTTSAPTNDYRQVTPSNIPLP